MQLSITSKLRRLGPYAEIARPDHWFKNVFMLPGFALAVFYAPDLLQWSSASAAVLAVVLTCIVASSNYTINEIIDAPTDRLHSVKRLRPAAMGKINTILGRLQWLGLGAFGIALGFSVNFAFGLTLFVFWFMGCIYNIPPIRCKDLPYLDVLCESFNNPIRLVLGWYALVPNFHPPVSLLIAYWMVGAFFMTAKRFAEYRSIGDAHSAGQYRKSFAHYTENSLLICMFMYTAACALFGGIFIVRYKLELILGAPLIAGCFGYYMLLTLRENSPVQNPERLVGERNFITYLALTVIALVAMMFVHIPAMYKLFSVPIEPPALHSFEPLWRIGE